MKKNLLSFVFFIVAILVALPVHGQLSKMNRPLTPSVDTFRVEFLSPGTDYSTAPLWVWNDLITEEDVCESLNALALQNVKQVFVHPRPGLVTEYLSDDWFRLWRASLNEAKKLGMKIWIYDENSYPSGFAGGLVAEAMPDSRAKAFKLEERPEGFEWNEDLILSVYQFDENGKYTNVTDEARSRGHMPPGNWLLALRLLAPESPWYADSFHVDLIKKGVTEKFLEITVNRYRDELGDAFGNLIPGIFTDEPHLFAQNDGCWSEDLSAEMERRYGFTFEEIAPLLQRRVFHTTSSGRVISWKEARFAYYQTLLTLFIDRWAKPYHNFCEQNNLEFTGHYWEHAWPQAGHNPDTMALSAWQHRPAIDILCNQYDEDHFDSYGLQFGNIRGVRELASLAHQLGRARTLSETYGAAGWDLRFEDMKRIGDWQYALGVNTTDEHLSFLSMRGVRKYDHPQSFSPHASWWRDYHVMADYHTRASYFVAQGTSPVDLLVLEPTTTGWFYQEGSELGTLAKSFANFIKKLERDQIEYDLASEDIMARLGHSDTPAVLTIGEAKYRHVVLPETMENMERTTLLLLATFVEQGGRLTRIGPFPLIDGREITSFDRETQTCYHTLFDNPKIETELVINSNIRFLDSESGIPTTTSSFHHLHRILPDGETLFLCNTQMTQNATGRIQIRSFKNHDSEECQFWSKAERFDLETGSITPFPVRFVMGENDSPGWTELDYDLPPCGSMAILFSDATADIYEIASEKEKHESNIAEDNFIIEPSSDPIVSRNEPNILVLDYCTLAIGGGTTAEDYVFRINQRLWQHAGLENDPWFCAIQFRQNIVRREFPDMPGFDVTWRFFVDDSASVSFNLDNPLEAVIESGNQFEVTCNGKPIKPLHGEWLDKSFHRFNLTDTVKVGENRITIHATHMTSLTELSPIYLRGNFSLEPSDTGFRITKEEPLLFGRDLNFAWKNQGMPFYPFGISYTEYFNLENREQDSQKTQYWVDLPRMGELSETGQGRWNGAVVEIRVNGQDAGCVFCEPCEKDVTSLIKPGMNEVTVTVIGTPRNLFGPHHFPGLRGTTSPGHYPAAPEVLPPGRDYDLIPYGLLERFVLVKKNSPLQK